MDDYKIIVEQDNSTVMAHYDVTQKPPEGYQSEARLEADFIKQLAGQGYEYARQVKNEASLLQNLRRQLEQLNDVTLSDSEWKRLLPMISNEQMTILDKTEMLQGKGYVLNLTMDNGLMKNIKLIDKQNVYNNRLQVINQYEEGTNNRAKIWNFHLFVVILPANQIMAMNENKTYPEIEEENGSCMTAQEAALAIQKAEDVIMPEEIDFADVVDGVLQVSPDIEEEIAEADCGETVSMSQFKTMFAQWL